MNIEPPSAPQTARRTVMPRAIAVELCVFLFLRNENGTAVLLSRLPAALKHAQAEIRDAIVWAKEYDWVKLGSHAVTLTATGIFVAKESLDLPR